MVDDKLKHIAIIMDGNGRWAEARGKKRSAGHKAGSEALEELALHAVDIGLKNLSVYAFSTDNFKRSDEEVNYLMNLFVEMFSKNYKRLLEKGIKVVFSGAREGLPEKVLKAMDEIVKKSKDNTTATLNVCLNYGGREEIIRAAERYHDDLVSGKVKKGEINRDTFGRYLDNDLPPIDILIRTGKERRLSNFMLYELFYAEMYFIETYFPDFTPEMLDGIISEFYGTERKFGAINYAKSSR